MTTTDPTTAMQAAALVERRLPVAQRRKPPRILTLPPADAVEQWPALAEAVEAYRRVLGVLRDARQARQAAEAALDGAVERDRQAAADDLRLGRSSKRKPERDGAASALEAAEEHVLVAEVALRDAEGDLAAVLATDRRAMLAALEETQADRREAIGAVLEQLGAAVATYADGIALARFLRDGPRRSWSPAPPVRVRDLGGAGLDGIAAAILAVLAPDEPDEAAYRVTQGEESPLPNALAAAAAGEG